MKIARQLTAVGLMATVLFAFAPHGKASGHLCAEVWKSNFPFYQTNGRSAEAYSLFSEIRTWSERLLPSTTKSHLENILLEYSTQEPRADFVFAEEVKLILSEVLKVPSDEQVPTLTKDQVKELTSLRIKIEEASASIERAQQFVDGIESILRPIYREKVYALSQASPEREKMEALALSQIWSAALRSQSNLANIKYQIEAVIEQLDRPMQQEIKPSSQQGRHSGMQFFKNILLGR